MRRATLALLFLLPATPLFAAEAWTIDPRHSKAEFSIRHMMIATVTGSFNRITGSVGKESIDATIDVASISTGEADRDKHLRSADFFDAEKFPKIAFKSAKITKEGDRWHVAGSLTMHGVTKDVTLDVDPPAGPINDLWGNLRYGIQAKTKINRKDFGIAWNRALDGGGVVLADEVAVTLFLEVTRPK